MSDEHAIKVGDQITSEGHSGVNAIYTIAAVKKRGGIYTCTTKSGLELRLRCDGENVRISNAGVWLGTSFRRTAPGDVERLTERRNVEKLRGLVHNANPTKWTPEQVAAVLAAWPKDVSK